MCGICGITNFNNQPVDIEDLRSIAGRMGHCRSDGEGFYCANEMGIGVWQLATGGTNDQHQPTSNESDTIWVVMNGIIYNYPELRHDLEQKGHIFKTLRNAEVIVHLYEEKGVDAVAEINGIFTFALYDMNRCRVWVVRDRLGAKPLFYIETKDRFAFATNLKSLKPMVNTKISVKSFLSYLGHAYIPTPDSIFENIYKLPPGHWVLVENNKVICRQYWQIQRFQTWAGSPVDAAGELENLITDSLRLQLPENGAVGILLSGGLDSSALVALSAAVMDNPIHTFTIDFDQKNSPDSHYARSVARHYQTMHQELTLGPEDFMNGLDVLIKYMDEPVSDSGVIPTFLLSKIAHEKGIKILLSGAGGDEIFGGYSRHHRARTGSPRWVAENMPYPLRILVSNIWSYFQPWRGLRAHDSALAFGAGISGVDLGICRRLFRDIETYQQLVEMIRSPFIEMDSEEKRHGYSYARMNMDLQNYLVDNIFSVTEKAAIAASVEVRTPLLDHRLVEFAFSLPEEINLMDGRAKGLFKEVLNKYLPEDLINRPKVGFNAPMNAWISEIFSSRIREELEKSTIPILNELFDFSLLQSVLINSNQRSMASDTLFGLYVFSRWYRECM